MRLFSLFATLLTGFSAAGALAAPIVCQEGELTRTVDVVYSDPGQAVPCEVLYDKPDEGAPPSTPWRATNESGYCEARAAELVTRLEGLGWTCAADDAAEP